MSELSFAGLGANAAAEVIKFLFAQAGELIKAAREHRAAKRESAHGAVEVAPVPSTAIAGPLAPEVDAATLLETESALAAVARWIDDRTGNLAAIDAADRDLVLVAERLRGLLEAIYRQRISFVGEAREQTGTRIEVEQDVGMVAGEVIGFLGNLSATATVRIDQAADSVRPGGRLIGADVRGDHKDA